MDYESMTIARMKDFARENGLRGYSTLRKADLITFPQNNFRLTRAATLTPRPVS